MRYKLDLTKEQNSDFIDFFQKKGFHPLTPSNLSYRVASIEFINGETYNKVPWSGLFILYFGKACGLEPVKIPAGSPAYSNLFEWFKPKVRDYKLEELGI